MNIVMAASEVAPFSRSGGLADVTAALARALSRAGQRVQIVTPYYPQRHAGEAIDISTAVTLKVQVGSKLVTGRVLESVLPDSAVRVLLIDQPGYFDRPYLYGEPQRDYLDNCERFVFFSRAVVECIRAGLVSPDVLHLHDWQTGLIPALLKIEGAGDPLLERVATLLTIHNLAFQGRFWHWDMELTGLDWKYFNWRQMEYFGDLNLLKTGISFADQLTTVSPSFAQEIQSDVAGCGLQGILRTRHEDLSGILYGIETHTWNPANDPALAQRYNSDTVTSGKQACRKAVRQLLQLDQDVSGPLCGCMVETASTSDLALLGSAAERILQLGLQLVLLFDREPSEEDFLFQLARQYPGSLACKSHQDLTLMHQMLGGADLFLSPAGFDPFGTQQMIQLAYGTVPVAKLTGGVADVVIPANRSVPAVHPNGFGFYGDHPAEMVSALETALQAFQDPILWKQLQQNGMAANHSWSHAAMEYQTAYEQARHHHALGLVQVDSST